MSIWSRITGFFNPIVRNFRNFIKALFTGALEVVLAQLKEIAQQVVAEVEEDPTIITNEDKRKEAIKRIKSQAILKGIEAKDSVVALAIELAIQYFKSSL